MVEIMHMKHKMATET